MLSPPLQVYGHIITCVYVSQYENASFLYFFKSALAKTQLAIIISTKEAIHLENYLADRRKELGLTQKEVAEFVGVAEATVSRWESGAIANMRRDRISLYAKILRTTPTFIMTGEANAPSQDIPAGFDPLPNMVRVPLIGNVACGNPITAEENLDGYVNIPDIWGASFALVCKGDSMSPRIQDGDLVAIRKQETVENGQIAAVRIGDEATLKRVYLSPGRLILQPENPAYEPIVLIGEEIDTARIEGLAVGFCRGL